MKKITLSLLAFFLLIGINSMAQETEEVEIIPLINIDFAPEFPGGEIAMCQFVAKNLEYPTEALKDSIRGKVYVKFLVLKTGQLTDIHVLKGLSPECDSAAVRVVRKMPLWSSVTPKAGVAGTYMTLPITFEMPPDKIYVTCEVMPIFPGGETKLMKFISNNLKFPPDLCVSYIRITARFVITNTGKVSNIQILRGADTRCDLEFVRMLRSMPDWTPAQQNGEAVNCYFTLPFHAHFRE